MNSTTEQDIEDVKKRVRQHVIIAAGLAVGTLLTLWTSQTDFGSHALNMTMTLGIAAIQAFMVAGFFMHLLSEKKMIYSFMVVTGILFVVLMTMTILAHLPGNVVHYSQ